MAGSSVPEREGRDRDGKPYREMEVEADFLLALTRRLPANVEVVEHLAHLYTDMGRFAEGLEMDRHVVQVKPYHELSWYNLACSLSLTGAIDEAFEALETAIELGYDDEDWMREDSDLAALRRDPRFGRLVAMIRAVVEGGGDEEDGEE